MKSRLTTLMLGIATMLASCSQDDGLQQTTVNSADGLVPVTLSASIDNGLQTRAVSADNDDAVGRCLLQIMEGTTKVEYKEMTSGTDGTYTASAMLDPTKSYTFLFWADADEGCYDATDLTNVTAATDVEANEVGIAWKGKETWSNGESTSIDATLTHAVTKVTLKTTSTVATGTKVTVSLKNAYASYDVDNAAVKGDGTGATFSYTTTGEITGTTAGAEVFSFYALVENATQDLTLQTGEQPAVTIPSVPLAQNKHVILLGDVADAGKSTFEFTANIANTWEGGTVTEKFPKIDLTAGSQTITDDGEYWIVGQTATNTLTINGNATVHIENTSIEVSTGNAITVTGGSPTIYVEGTNTVESSNGAGIYVAQGSTVTVTSTSRDNNVLTARGGNGGSGIGGGCETLCGNIEIKNVTVNAYGCKGISSNSLYFFSAGIGGSGGKACGTITIDNATVFAYGASDGATGSMATPGIGGGVDSYSAIDNIGKYGTITIRNNSTVSVQRGSSVSDYIGSAGITISPANSKNGIDATVDESSEVKKLN